MNKYPDFFVVGGPKCGTTSLYTYFAEHPKIFVPRIKEIHYFSSDFSDKWRGILSEHEYLSLYAGAGPAQVKGDFSVTYLSSAVATKEILRNNPDARVIAILRNPVTAVPSYHSQLLYSVMEDIEDPHEAWRAQAERQEGKRVPRTCKESKMLLYREMFNYPDQLKRLFEIVPESQRTVLIFERFVRDPLSHYVELLRFMQVPYDGRTQFHAANRNKVARSYRIERFLRHPPFPLNHLRDHLKPPLNRLGIHPVSKIRSLNRRVVKREPVSKAFQGELEQAFAEDKAEVEALLGTRLPEWEVSR